MRRVGATLCGKYRLQRVLGVGGMAAVYAAVHRNGHTVAIKILHEGLATDPEIERLFRREAQLANKIGHPGVVPVIDDDVTEDGCVFLVMPLLQGETLRARAERLGRKLPVAEVVVVAHAVLEVLAAAHAKKIVHRDVKPENIFLTSGGEIRVLDFGIGRFFETQDTASATRSGRAIGTPAFMAPEQALGRQRDIDGQTDLWALGATMFALLSGRFVHEAESATEIAVLAATRPARPIAQVASPRCPLRLPRSSTGRSRSRRRIAGLTPRRWTRRCLWHARPRSGGPPQPFLLSRPPHPEHVNELAAAPTRTTPPVRSPSPWAWKSRKPSGRRIAHPSSGDGGPPCRNDPDTGRRRRGPHARARPGGQARRNHYRGGALRDVGRPTLLATGRSEAYRERRSCTSSTRRRRGAPEHPALYNDALRDWHDAAFDRMRTALEQAILADTTFAAAHLYLVLLTFFTPGANETGQRLQKAIEHRATLSAHDDALLDAILPVRFVPPDLPQVVQKLAKLHEQDPTDAITAYAFALFSIKAGQLQSAATALEEISHRDPSNAAALYGKALVLLFDNRVPEAVSLLTACLERSPAATSCLSVLTKLQSQDGHCVEAERLAREYASLAPTSPLPQWLLLSALAGEDAPTEALEGALSHALSLAGPSSRAYGDSIRASLDVLRGISRKRRSTRPIGSSPSTSASTNTLTRTWRAFACTYRSNSATTPG